MLDNLLDLLFPRQCLGCGKWGRYFCNDCEKSIRFYSGLISPSYHPISHIDGLFVLAHYDGLIRKAIKDIKYRGKFAICLELADMIRENYRANFPIDYLIPVPLSSNRLATRGFNQAEKLARALKFAPVLNCLARTRDTKPQFDLKISERQQNVQNAFVLASHQPLVTGHSLCLIDDVATTGSTLSECAKVLKRSGAKSVFAICIARGG